ncbi:hypothetical protein HW090_09545 [Pseudomonas sp. ABC1]|uniref:hypothetical protein n=1 Tax=Pseudomonas sp. ABC1 TaxID=2748080 RepID=UPI0015C2FFF5|nr:hypothetical protein [Pseudomonas sp. ABC1]QLF93427.1 hypothetical protein HW090_09545 [Pseudomonas sp. ABC1]
MAAGGAGSDVACWGALVLAAAVAAGGAAWKIQLDKVSERDKQIAAMREASSWTLPETIKNLKNASAEINASLKSRADQQLLEGRVAELQQENNTLDEKLKVATVELSEANKKYLRLKSKLQGAAKQPVTVELSEGQSEDVIPGLAALAVEIIYPRSRVKGTFSGQPFEGRAGERLSYKVAGMNCTVFIKTISRDNTILSTACDG